MGALDFLGILFSVVEVCLWNVIVFHGYILFRVIRRLFQGTLPGKQPVFGARSGQVQTWTPRALHTFSWKVPCVLESIGELGSVGEEGRSRGRESQVTSKILKSFLVPKAQILDESGISVLQSNTDSIHCSHQ